MLGPSGSGKSTLLRAVAGLEPDDHRHGLRGTAPTSPACRPTGAASGSMFQDHALFPHRDVRGNVAFGLRMQRLPRARGRRRTRDDCSRSSASPASGTARITELSGGEQQRVALARALAAAPAPADARRAARCPRPRAAASGSSPSCAALFVRLELTILFVTHDHDEAFALADRRRRDARGPDRAVRQPRRGVAPTGQRVRGPIPRLERHRAFGDGTVAVRPGALRVVEGPGITGVVTSRTFRREHFLLDVRVEISDRPEFLQVEVPLSAHSIPDVGSRVTLGAEPGATVALD